MPEQAPQPAVAHLIQPAGDRPAEARKGRAQLGRVVGQRPAFGGPSLAFLDRDDVAKPVRQRIADEVPPLAHEQLGDRGGARFQRDQRAPCDLAGEERRLGPVQRRADARMQPVRADQQGGGGQVGDLVAKLDPNAQIARGAGERLDQAGAVDHAEGGGRTVAGIVDPADQRAGPARAQFDAARRGRYLGDPVPDPQRAEDAQRVGADLDARADLAQRARAFQHGHPRPAPGQGQRCRQPADPRADDGDGPSRQMVAGLVAQLVARINAQAAGPG